jgi:hypothetical protein
MCPVVDARRDARHTRSVPNRREIWREFMGRFEPSADPLDAVKRGFYVPRPGRSLAEQLASRIEIKPSASHLLVGGIGSGKTTQLLVARERLAVHEDICAAYVDVSLSVNLGEFIRGEELLAAVGLELGKWLKEDQRTLEPIADSLRHLELFLVLPWEDAFDELFGYLRRLHSTLARCYPYVVLLIDSLDRLSNLVRFARLVEEAIKRLHGLGIGIILVGPLSSLYGLGRTTADHFDRSWHLPTVDVQNDAEGRDFLLQVIRARDPEGMIRPEAAEGLAAFSGGAMRDLIALTQAAAEEAYVDGGDHIERIHVETAADLFGRKQLVGLDSKELEVLQRVRTQGTFVQTSEKDLALLATRRVLEYANGRPRFAVHPTIETLLGQIVETL